MSAAITFSFKLLKIIVAVIKRGSYFEKYQGINPDLLKHPEKQGNIKKSHKDSIRL